MPTLATIEGLRIAMYADDHEPAHVHVFRADVEYRLTVADGEVLTMQGRIPAKALQAVRSWIEANRGDLAARWAALTRR